MRRLLSLSLMAYAVIAISCSKQTEEVVALNHDSHSETIPVQEALASLDSFLNDVGMKTKAGDNKTYDLTNISSFGKRQLPPSTKAVAENDNLPDTLIYLVPFLNDEGVAVLAANRQLKSSILCVTEEGIITAEDFENAYEFLIETPTKSTPVENEEREMEDMGESIVPALLLSSILSQINEDDMDYCDINETKSIEIVSQHGPYVLTKWDQHAPFSDLNSNQAVGCCTIAVSQILVSNASAPSMNFDNYLCSWSTLASVYRYTSPGYAGSDEAKTQAAHFIKHVMNSDNLNGTGSSGSSIKAKKVFQNFGYYDVVRHWGYGNTTQSAVNSCLNAGYAVYADGLKEWSTTGHCWVIDGVMVRKENGSNKRYHHINWGWNGEMDGYYTEHVYKVPNRQFYDTVIDAQTYTSGPTLTSNYNWDLWFITYSGV